MVQGACSPCLVCTHKLLKNFKCVNWLKNEHLFLLKSFENCISMLLLEVVDTVYAYLLFIDVAFQVFKIVDFDHKCFAADAFQAFKNVDLRKSCHAADATCPFSFSQSCVPNT